MRPKVLFLIHTLGAGGAEKVLINLVNNLDQTKYDITLMTVIDTGVFKNYIAEGIKYKSIFKIPKRKNTGTEKKDCSGSLHENYSRTKAVLKKCYQFFWRHANCKLIYKCFIREKYDYEIAFLEGICAKIIAASNNKESIKYSWIHVDIMNERKSDLFFKGIEDERKVYNSFDKVICVSDYVKASVEEKLLIDREKLLTIYNVIDSAEIERKADERIELDSPYFSFVSVGRLSPQKGYDRLLKVINRLKKEGYNFKVFIIGEGPEKSSLTKYIEKNHLEKYVELLGFKKNPYPYMKKCDAFVCSSRAEGFSTVASEAIVVGKACVVTDCSGMKELFGENNEYGYIVENSEDGIYRGMLAFLENPQLVKYYSERAKCGAKRFNISATIEAFERKLLDVF